MSFSHDAGFEHDDRDINSQQNVSQGDSQDDSFLHRRPRSQSQSQSQSQRDDDHDDEQDYGDGDADADRMTFVCEMDSAKELQSLLSCLANFKNTKPGQQHTAQAMVTDKDLVFVLVSLLLNFHLIIFLCWLAEWRQTSTWNSCACSAGRPRGAAARRIGAFAATQRIARVLQQPFSSNVLHVLWAAL